MRLGLAGQKAERGVALQHGVLCGGERLHLEPVVHEGEGRAAPFLGGPGGGGERGPEGLAARRAA